jgi:hypothetical protein
VKVPAARCFSFQKPLMRMYMQLLEELLIHLLDVQGFLDAAADAVAYQSGA